MNIFNLKVKCVKYWEVSMAKLPSEKKQNKTIPPDPNCLFISASRLFLSPLMHAGQDKEVGNVQLLAEVPRLRQCVYEGE